MKIRGRMSTVGKHAVVMGGSMAGLLQARVLSERFEQVTILERDLLPEGPDHRKAVPQGAHNHGLLARGLSILTRLFPDLVPSMLEGGAVQADFSRCAWHHFGVWKRVFETGIPGMIQSRPFLEWHVRRRVAALPNVRLLVDHRVQALTTTPDRKRVTGVRLTTPDGAPLELAADWLVDATGRGSRTPELLESLGFRRPPESVVDVGVGYASRVYRRTRYPGDWVAMMVLPTPPDEKRAAVLFAVEDDRWICTLQGWLGDHPPTDDAGYLEFARSLAVPDVYNLIRSCDPLSEISVYKFPNSLRRRYERVRLPDRLVVVGDAVCSFNPIYGQGMSVSALEAEATATQLDRQGGLDGASARLQKTIGSIVDIPWVISAGEDFRYLEMKGDRPFSTNFINGYVARVHRLADRDEKVLLAFYKVMHMLEPPTHLMRPDIAWRVLRSVGRPATANDAARARHQ
jgi:2-polyprenyl-6-methoxyphenol hydroxylase-like FAD-dependent oxidoreductase